MVNLSQKQWSKL